MMTEMANTLSGIYTVLDKTADAAQDAVQHLESITASLDGIADNLPSE